MRRQRLGGLLIVLALLLTIAASIVFPVSYYMTQDEGEREAIMAANRWASLP